MKDRVRAHIEQSDTGLLLLGVLSTLVGYWAPWVRHPAAGLVQNAFDLSEFVKFLPQVKSGSEPVLRWLFFLPLPTVALSLSIWAAIECRRRPSSSGRNCLHVPLVGVGLLLLIILIPPYPYTPERLMGREFGARTLLALVSWVAYLLTLVGARDWLTRRRGAAVLAILALIGTIAPIVQYLSLHDALSAVYGRSVAIGWGVWLMVTGMVVVLAGTALRLSQERVEDSHSAAEEGRSGG